MITKPKGTNDLINKNASSLNNLRTFINELMNKYNYDYIETPVFESSELFHRGVGETTDIVTKETYDFVDRGNRNMTLRPEGTAGIVRSFIENKDYADPIIPKKLYYFEKMYRYERPQSGRYREFFQFGCEAFGSSDPAMDAEIISIPVTLFRLLGLTNIKVNINTLGDDESRKIYKDALIKYLEPNINQLCEDCKERFIKNPLRILDCKVDSDNKILKNIPRTIDYLNEESEEHFNKVLEYLDALEIDYEINTNIVRGLDYYTHTVFEIEAEAFGKQSILCGGGRYNNLVKELDGPETPAVGFGMGIERLLAALESQNIDISEDKEIDCYITPCSQNEKAFGLALTASLRMLGIRVETDYMNRNLKSNFKQAERLNAKLMIIIGEEEMNNNYLTIKNLKTKQEEKVSNMDLITYLSENLKEDGYNCSNDHECSCGEEHDHECTCGGDCHCHDED